MRSADELRRLLEMAIVIPVLLLSLPLQALVAAAILIRDGRPVLFRQERLGRHGEPFLLIKFRTMTTESRDPAGLPLDEEGRVTPLGRLLRRFSLDELPELWNVLRGDMALVGPRPLPVRYLPRYTVTEARRHEVRPGLTGLAQVSGRNALGWDDRLVMDVWYVDHRSIGLDLRILVRTIGVVLSGDRAGVQVMAEFRPDHPAAALGESEQRGPAVGVSSE